MKSSVDDEDIMVEAPRVYECELKGTRLRCEVVTATTSEALIEFCHENPDAKVLVRYPRGQHNSKLWRQRVEQTMHVYMSETFEITKLELSKLLNRFYHFNPYMAKKGRMEEKLSEVWDPIGLITIYIVKLRERDTVKNLKTAKQFIRSSFDTMHILHTSDNQKETLYFAEHIWPTLSPN